MNEQPLVTCIMPTRGRPKYAAQAVAFFLNQTYPNRELLILDDNDEPSFPERISRPDEPIIGYYREPVRLGIGAKRNRLNERARGSVIVHWDSDDWYAPERIADQVERLEQSGKALTGYHSILFYEEQTGRWARYTGTANYACGTSFCYLKSFWLDHRFNESVAIGEDNEMVNVARERDQIIAVDGRHMLVARVHAENTSPNAMDRYGRVHEALIPKDFPL